MGHRDIRRVLEETADPIWRRYPELGRALYELVANTEESAESIRLIRPLEERMNDLGKKFLALNDVLTGQITLDVGPDETISAAVLNAAAAGMFKTKVHVTLIGDNVGLIAACCSSPELTVTGGGTFADGDIDDPTVPSPIRLELGRYTFEMTWDTDAGQTKTYAEDDEATATIAFPGGAWLGNTIANAVKTYTVVA